VLRRIQADFGGDINLVDSVREFIKDGRLVKISEQTNREVSYHFFLFSHIFAYASDGMQTKFKIHRVIHLSLCKVIDLKNFAVANAFKIVSPQKSFVVAAATAQEKKDWLDSISKHGRMVMEERRTYMESINSPVDKEKEKEKKKEEEKDGDDEDMMRRFSTFIGHNSCENFFGDEIKGAKKNNTFCKLCIRPFAFFRARTQCRWCRDVVCSECCSQKAKVPGGIRGSGGKKKVCDACYGVLNGMVGHDVEFLTELDCKKHPHTSTPLPSGSEGVTSQKEGQKEGQKQGQKDVHPKEKEHRKG